MSEPGYIYPQWHSARRKLTEALGLTQAQYKILDEWMRAYVFEIGVDQTIVRDERDLTRLEEQCRYEAARMLADELMKLGLFMETINDRRVHGLLHRDVRTSILLFGSPRLGTGPAKRQSI